MNLLNIHQERRSDRKFLELTDKDQIIDIIVKYFDQNELKINEFPKDVHAKIEVLKSGKNIHLTLNKLLPSDYNLDIRDIITLYSYSNRYIEIQLRKGFFDGQSGYFDLIKAKIAANDREDIRLPLGDTEVISENFIISQYFFHPKMKKSPSIVKKAFDELRLHTKREFKSCEFILYENAIKGRDINTVRETGKPIYIEDTRKGTNNPPPNSDFLDYRDHLGPIFIQELELLKTKRIRSILIIPIFYHNLLGIKSTVGFFKMTASTNIIPTTIIPKLYHYADLMIAKIDEFNNDKIKVTQKVLDISTTGVKINITHQDIAKTLLLNPEEIQFDIKIETKMKFSFYCRAMNMFPQEDGSFNVGFQILGVTNKIHTMEDWHDFVDQYYKVNFKSYIHL